MLDAIVRWLAAEGVEWTALKAAAQPLFDISHDALHVILGVLVQVAVAWGTRSSVGRWFPWLVVLGLELINEYNDIRVDPWPEVAAQLGEGGKDAILTMLLPTILMVLVRMRPRLFRPS